MLEAMISGLQQLFDPRALGLMLLGIMLGLFFGIVPGLGAIIGMALLIPFVFGMDPMMGCVLLLALYATVTTGVVA